MPGVIRPAGRCIYPGSNVSNFIFTTEFAENAELNIYFNFLCVHSDLCGEILFENNLAYNVVS